MDVSEAEKLLFRAWDRVFANEQRVGFDGLSRAEQVFSVIWALEGEVNNGGFSQYMFNSSGDQAALAPPALRAVGAEAAAEVCERFYAMLPDGAPARTQDERQAQLDAMAATLGEDRFEEVSIELEQPTRWKTTCACAWSSTRGRTPSCSAGDCCRPQLRCA